MRKPLVLVLAISAALVSCSDDEKTLTEQINKVETSYYEGAPVSLTSSGPKVETSAPDWYVKKVFEETNQTIDKLVGVRASGRIQGGSYDIGYIVSSATTCYGGVKIIMDCENSSPETFGTPKSGTTWKPWDVSLSQFDFYFADLQMAFCRMDGYAYSRDRYHKPHAVLQLGPLAVAGTTRIGRKFDNEDSNNHNKLEGDVSPGVVDKNTAIFFLAFPEKAYPGWWVPNIAGGVFADPNDSFGYAFHYFVDDEDWNNANYWSVNGTRTSDIGYSYMGGVRNTSFYILMFK